jgi:hypothetical protein
MKYVIVEEFTSDPVLVLVREIESVPFEFEVDAVRFAELILKLPQVIPGSVQDIVTGTVGGGVVIRVPASSTPTMIATTIKSNPNTIELLFISDQRAN